MRLLLLCLLPLTVQSCAFAPAAAPLDETRQPTFDANPEIGGLQVVLSEGTPSEDAGDAPPVAVGKRISKKQTAALLARLPDLDESHGDRQVFALRDRSLPAPRTGETVDTAFPPEPEAFPEIVGSGDLSVVRFSPEGSVPIAPKLSVSFDQPMVVLSSQDEAAETTPVTLQPEPPGQWRWIGTKTVLFEPDVRFPMSTNYRVEVPKGTQSTTGGGLKEAKSWTFDTPLVELTNRWPGSGPTDLDPNVFMHFNQRVDEDVVWQNLRLTGGSGAVEIVRLTEGEIAADPHMKSSIDGSEPGRWMAFRPVSPLAKGTNYVVSISPGALSAEGPKETVQPLRFTFRTYDPLRVKNQTCPISRRACTPSGRWWVQFNNPLDPQHFDTSALRIEPELDEPLQISASGSVISFDGYKPGSRVYTVTLPAGLTDVHGQELGEETEVAFHVGTGQPSLHGIGPPMIVLDPNAPPSMSVYSVNHQKLRLRVYRVKPADWSTLSDWWNDHQQDWHHRAHLPGERIEDTVLNVGGDVDAMVETAVKLKPYLDGRYGQLLVWVTPTKPPKEPWQRQEVIHWIQRTDIGLTAFHDRGHLEVWANELSDGAVADDVQLSFAEHAAESMVSANGTASLDLKASSSDLLLARRGDDLALLPHKNAFWHRGSWSPIAEDRSTRWFVFDDRGMYKPGETVTVKGWLRTLDGGPEGDVVLSDRKKIKWELIGTRGNKLVSGQLTTSRLDGFDLSFTIPDTANLGTATLRLSGPTLHSHPVLIQEFRRPEFEVAVTVDSGHHILGDHVHASVDAKYYAGGGLPFTETTWTSHAEVGNYVPPNRSDYQFGRWSPWWGGWRAWNQPEAEAVAPDGLLEGRTDSRGTHDIDIHLQSLRPARPMTLTVQAAVVDVNRQQWAADSSFVVHPSALYVGLRTEKSFVERGGRFDIDAIVSDIDGQLVAGQGVDMTLNRLDWGPDAAGRWRLESTEAGSCVLTSKEDPGRCTFEPSDPGAYELIARIEDGMGRPNETTLRLWVAGGELPARRDVALDEVQLVPSAREFFDGDVAEIFVRAPFTPAEGMLTYRRSGILHKERFRMEGATTTVRVPILDSHVPNLHIQVDLVGENDEKPAYATGTINLPVPPGRRTLSVTATPALSVMEPGGSTEIEVLVRDASGEPAANSEVALVVVDESILALTGYQLPDPVALFYTTRKPYVFDYHLRSQVVLARSKGQGKLNLPAGTYLLDGANITDPVTGSFTTRGTVLTKEFLKRIPAGRSYQSAVGLAPGVTGGGNPNVAGGASNENAPDRPMANTAIALRTDFSALALFEGDLRTDARGRVSIPITLPDSLTRYRVMAVAAHGENHFGKGESAITARNPVMVRPSPPRFMNFGDRAELPVVIQNQTDKKQSVDVAMRATNALLLDEMPRDPLAIEVAGHEEAGQRISVPPNDRVEVRFPVAADMAGTARFQVAVAAGDFADAIEIDFPVWTPATTEAFATYGEVDDGAIVQPVAAPDDVWTQFGGLEVTTSSTELQALTDAVIYLYNYPFFCSEQLASRILAIAALRDVLDAFDAAGLPGKKELEVHVDRDLAQLRGRQNADGGFGFWKRGDPSWPYLSIHVAHALARAEGDGFNLDLNMRSRSVAYLRNIDSHVRPIRSIRQRRTLLAYALYTRLLLNDRDGPRARKLFAEAGLDGLSLEAQGWLMHVLAADGADEMVSKIERHWMNKVSETAAAANFVTHYSDDAAHVLLHSDRRVDGVLLEALVKVKPENELIPKVVRGLLAHRKRGRWGNTQENAFVLLAMDAYFNEFEGTTPDFVSRVWLGDEYIGDHTFEGRTTERARTHVPMGYLTDPGGPRDLILQKDGAGRMYYRIGMQYAPRDLQVEAADRGFAVERSYEAVDDASDVRFEDGVWYVKAGAKVRIRVTMVATGRRYHVALVDPLPAGFETMNPALKVTGAIPQDPKANPNRYWWWTRTWYEHENLRDERVEAFASLLWAGVHEYTYVARATTPGQFVVPPPKAEEMYNPETFGRGASTRVVIH